MSINTIQNNNYCCRLCLNEYRLKDRKYKIFESRNQGKNKENSLIVDRLKKLGIQNVEKLSNCSSSNTICQSCEKKISKLEENNKLLCTWEKNLLKRKRNTDEQTDAGPSNPKKIRLDVNSTNKNDVRKIIFGIVCSCVPNKWGVLIVSRGWKICLDFL